jgi:hypothetical protein
MTAVMIRTSFRQHGLPALAALLCILTSCVYPGPPIERTDKRRYRDFRAFELDGWAITPSLIETDPPLNRGNPKSLALEVRCEQRKAGMLLGLDSVAVEGLPLRDSVGELRPLAISNCAPNTDFQYYYYCCLNPGTSFSIRTWGNLPQNIIVMMFVTTLDPLTGSRATRRLAIPLSRSW